MQDSSSIFGERPQVYRPSVAAALGSLTQAIVLEQLHYWVQRATKEHDGHTWVYKTYKEWGDELGLSYKQTERALDALKERGLVISIQNPYVRMDQTRWWKLDDEGIVKLSHEIRT
jgi:DNA-binding transcriptional ArsR family regulator